ncbi:HIR complex subunit [Lunasporangiospora selenospora]|uniref:Protein HIR n=1 Tax=Lunasporangiospora selenospora TaxID=979761 RepID=A0A9P6KHK9_9FUNG|nr:HIR complex subunit [Lunasporangiospora selenospora]
MDAEKDQGPDAKRHLCTMNLHNGAVLCVKWSNGKGKYLATGSDDMIVMIWQLDRSSEAWGGGSFGDSPNIENWRAVKRLAGHESDVTDVAWSPENTYLASAGLDSKIIIWDGKNFNRIMTLDQHQGFVKGLTWDPVGKYLASQSDDKSVRIWRITDWEVEVETYSGVSIFINTNVHSTSTAGLLMVDISQLQTHTMDQYQSLRKRRLYLNMCFAVLLFQSENLGEAVPAEERHQLLAKYGYERRGEVMAETPTQLAMEEQLKESAAKSRMDEIMNHDSSMEGVTTTFDTPSHPSVFVNATTNGGSSTAPQGSLPTSPREQRTHMSINDQTVTVTSDGKKRIKPLFLGSGISTAPATRTSFQPAKAVGEPANSSQGVSSYVERGDPTTAIPDGGFPSVVIGTKRKDPPTNGPSTLTGPAKKGTEATGSNSKGKGGGQRGDEDVTSRVAVATPFQKGNVVWVDYLPSPVLLMTGNSHFSAVACEDGGVYVYSPAGRRLLPCIILESAATLMECDKDYLMCLTSCGLVSSWNIIQQIAVLSSVSIAPILQLTSVASDTVASSVSITSASVRQNGLPLLTTSAGQGYTYHEGLKSWVKIIDPWFATSSFFGSDSLAVVRGDGDPVVPRKGVLAHLQAAATGGRLDKDVAFAQELLNVEESVQSVVTLAHLENQIASAQILGTPSEFKQWMRCYAQRLADESSLVRIEELCKFLLGPVYQGGEKSDWQPMIMNIQKREVLKDILPVLSSNRSLQRIVKEYLTGLEMVSVNTSPKAATTPSTAPSSLS